MRARTLLAARLPTAPLPFGSGLTARDMFLRLERAIEPQPMERGRAQSGYALGHHGSLMSSSDETRLSQKERVYRGTSLADVHLMRDLIESDGIPAEIRGELLAGLAGAIPVADTMPTIWVLAHNATRARALMASVEAMARSGASWPCTCGEENEATFGSCWRCGRMGPGSIPDVE